jgi:hypothetical protein
MMVINNTYCYYEKGKKKGGEKKKVNPKTSVKQKPFSAPQFQQQPKQPYLQFQQPPGYAQLQQ